MLYIIDANNLAGKLRILKEKDFDRILIEIIKEWHGSQKNRIILIFDSLDPMGDKYTKGNITVIYTPRDNYYRSADDKILEVAAKEIKTGYPESGSLTVITSDRELTTRIKKFEEKIGTKLTIVKAEDFAQKLTGFFEDQIINPEEADLRGLARDDIDKINNDLLKLWK